MNISHKNSYLLMLQWFLINSGSENVTIPLWIYKEIVLKLSFITNTDKIFLSITPEWY